MVDKKKLLIELYAMTEDVNDAFTHGESVMLEKIKELIESGKLDLIK
jgi:hypothetical protein